MKDRTPAFWSIPPADLLTQVATRVDGLTGAEAQQRLEQTKPCRTGATRRARTVALLLAQFQSPIILILLTAAALSLVLRASSDALIIVAIVLVSGLLGFWQEWSAADAVARLTALVQVTTTVIRDGAPREVPATEVVPGDIVSLSAGASIPADCAILGSKDLFVKEAALTGETFPVEKASGVLPADTPLAQRFNALFWGTHVVSGSATAVVVYTGAATEFGRISARLALRPPETEFERGLRRFGYFLMEVTLLLILAIFAVNVYLARPVLDSLLFSLALAVGLTPQLLPAIISINLAHGARRMADAKVIVKRLTSIENFGSMTVLCSDKTGTLTEGRVRVHAALDLEGYECESVLRYAYLNSVFETGFANPIDEAIRARGSFDLGGCEKLDEIPYDFLRRRLSVVMIDGGHHRMVTKGAVQNVLAVCTFAQTAESRAVEINTARDAILERAEALNSAGFRTLGVAIRDVGSAVRVTRDDEAGMTFIGLLVLADSPKAGIAETIGRLQRFGVALKIVTGDSRLVATSVARQVGIPNPKVITGGDLHRMSDDALRQQAEDLDVFAEVEPPQKERIVLALRKTGHVVGFLGDGINDAPALHAADVGISVESAVDVAKDAADFVMLERDLGVLVSGLAEGRRTFANTLKYVYMATSANFGNMFSMAGASLFLPFLPLLPKQILLTNFMTDIPEMTIATDTVDEELVERPRRWSVVVIRKFMLVFGLISSVFDYLTFGALWFVGATPAEFRTGWFVESVISASLIVLVIRTRRPFFTSRPSRALVVATLFCAGATVALPFTPLARLFGFTALPVSLLVLVSAIVFVYIVTAEWAKKAFFRRIRV